MSDQPIYPEAQFVHAETQFLHGGNDGDEATGATTNTIYPSAAFAYDSAEAIENVFAGREPGYIYTRLHNPTVTAFEKRMTELEGGFGALACASGMAAISSTVLALAGQGDEIISGTGIFGGTYSLFSRTLPRCGVVTRFVPSTDIAAYRAAITDRTRLIFVETVGNPKLDVPDIAAIARVAKDAGIVLVVDSTTTTPYLVRPGALGADIVIHSTSKFINGHGTAIGGVIIDCGSFNWGGPRAALVHEYHKRAGRFAFLAALRSLIHRDLGCCLSPFSAFLMSIGIDSLGVRMQRHCENAAQLAAFLAGDARVVEVRYPGLAAHPEHAVAARQFGGKFGALMAVRLGTRERAFRFINGLERALILANLGDVKTLVIHPASTICRDASAEGRAAMGVTDDLVRISVGIEHIDDIREDFSRSLGKL